MSCQLLVEVSNLVIRLDLVAITPHLSSRGTYVAMHESARSFVCSIGRTTLDIRLAHARFPSAADTPPPLVRLLLFRLEGFPPPAAPPLSPHLSIFQARRSPGLLLVLLGCPRGCAVVFFF